MRIEEVHLHLPSKDLKESLQFYVEGLFFRKIFESPFSCAVALGPFFLTFFPAQDRPMPIPRIEDGWLFSVQVDEIQEYYQKVKSVGRAKFEQELELMMPGIWQFSVVDNTGYHIGFAQPSKDHPASH